MKFEDRAPKPEAHEIAGQGSREVVTVDLTPFAPDIAAAARTEGAAEVGVAIDAVARGVASPEALLAWIDELREPDKRHPVPDAIDNEEGFQLDFIADSKHAGGAVDTPAPPAPDASIADAPPGDNFSDYFFSASRKRQLAEDGVIDDPDAADPNAAAAPETVAPKKKS